MKARHPSLKLTALVMAAVMLVVSVPPRLAHAGLVTTEEVVDSVKPSDRARVLEFVQREDVRAQFMKFGVTASEAEARVAALSDGEVARIAGYLDAMPAGQAPHPGLAIVIVLTIVFFVLVLTDLAGLTDIFPFVKKGKR
jgi:hypothetical protein